MKVFDAPFVPQPEGTSSFPSWLQVDMHPAKPGRSYSVKRGPEGTRFRAYLAYDGSWFIVTGENPDNSLILGERLNGIQDLRYVAQIQA